MGRHPLDAAASVLGPLAVMALGLSAGALLTEGAVLVPTWRALPPQSFLAWYASNATLLFDFFGTLEIAGALLAVAAAGLYGYQRRQGRGPLGVSAVLAVAVLAAFPLYFRDANASFAAGTIGLERLADELARWASWHWGRTAIGAGAFAAAVLGVIPSHPTPRAANLAIVRPPLVYLVSIVAGVLLQVVRPLPFVPRVLAAPVGGLLVMVAGALFSYSVGRFRAAGTPVPGNKPTTVIVRTGPYRFSRNPIYLAFSLLQLGIAIWLNSLWLIATLITALVVMAYVVIPKEERYLEGRFGAEYLEYKAAVGRWL